MENIIKKIGYNIYYKNNSSSIFSAYRIIVPGMSEIIDKNHFAGIHSIRHETELIRHALQKKPLTADIISSMYLVVKRNDWLNELVINKCSFIDITIFNKTVISLKFYEMIMFMLLNANEFEKAYDIGIQFINKESDKISLCLMFYLKYIIENKILFIEKEEFQQIYSFFFDKQIISFTYMLLYQTSSVFQASINDEKDLIYQNRKELFKKISNGNI